MLQQDLEAFLADVAQRLKPASVSFYRGRSRWIAHALGERTWESLTAQQVLAALDQANRWPGGERKSGDTQRGNIIAWDQFQRWAIETGRLAEPVTQKIKKPAGKLRERLPTIDEIRRVLDGSTADFARVYRALLLTGARPGELCRATIGDYDRTSGIITLQEHKTRGKTGKPRIIPITVACAELLATAIGDRTAGPIFLTARGLAWTTSRLSQAFRRRRDKLGLDKAIKLYATRHKFATELCHAQGAHATASVLGHAGLDMIQRYVHTDAAQVRKFAAGVDPSQLLPPDTEPPAKAA